MLTTRSKSEWELAGKKCAVECRTSNFFFSKTISFEIVRVDQFKLKISTELVIG